MLSIVPHPLLEPGIFSTTFPVPLQAGASPAALVALLSASGGVPFSSSDLIRARVRDLLRATGFKPTGRSKPASEYLIRAIAEGVLGSINCAVDACNVVSYHSGLPISVVDLDRLEGTDWLLRTGHLDEEYVFNASGQVLDVEGLLCLADGAGACASPVKDSQRTKVMDGCRRTLSIVWGTTALPGYTSAVTSWYRQLLETHGATTEALGVG